MPRISLIRWAYEALAVNEFDGLEIIPESRIGPKSVSSGNQVLESIGYGSSTVKRALLALAAITGFNYIATYVSLVRQTPQFERLVPYDDEEEGGGVDVVANVDVSEDIADTKEIDDQMKLDIDSDSRGDVKLLKRRRRSSMTNNAPRRAPTKPAMPTP